MYWESGGGDLLVIIHVPAPHEWQKRTRLPLSQRAETLEFHRAPSDQRQDQHRPQPLRHRRGRHQDLRLGGIMIGP